MWAWTAAIVNHAEKLSAPLTPDEWANFITYWVRIDAADYATAAMSMMLHHVEYLRKDMKYYEKIAIWQKHYKAMMED
jgi:hypothetical protein